MAIDNIRTAVPQRPMDTYSVSTPYGILTISNGGRTILFELYEDIHQSRHNTALFTYLQQLLKQGIARWNTDHLHVPGRDRTLSLRRGKTKLDLVYEHRGKLYECELKTSREIGLDTTAQQLKEMAKHCENLTVLVPRGCIEDMATVLHLINLAHQIRVAPYDMTEDNGD
jgi:hypothetical protein